MSLEKASSVNPEPGTKPPRRKRYRGKYPRRFAEKYKERNPAQYQETVAKVLASGKTPAGMHRPIMVEEVLRVLDPQPGQRAVDCTLGYGGHALALLSRLLPGGRLIALDADPLELPKTESRIRALGYDLEAFAAHSSNFAGLPQILHTEKLSGVDMILADLGVSSMQLDDPVRGFSMKNEGPLDMRMNPNKGQSAGRLVANSTRDALHRMLSMNADEPHAAALAAALAGRSFATTLSFRDAIRHALPAIREEEREMSVRRVFQALRIAVNDEFSALEMFLRHVPACLNPGGRVAILTFHSGEDRRVKKSFEAGAAQGAFSEIAAEVIRPAAAERHANPRSAPAKLRWARKS